MADASKVYLIKDLARLSGHSVYTLKFYLKEGLIREVSRSESTGYRYFDDSTLAQLTQIRGLRKERQSLAQIRQRLGSATPIGGHPAVAAVSVGHSAAASA